MEEMFEEIEDERNVEYLIKEITDYCSIHTVNTEVWGVLLSLGGYEELYWKLVEKKGEFDVFDVLDVLREEGIEKGAKGIIKICFTFKQSKEFILKELQEDLEISFEQANKYYEEFIKNDK